jgi:hypothetical protein
MRLVAFAAELSGGYERLARRLGVTEVEIVSWAHGIGAPSGPVAGRMAELIRKSSLRAARACMLARRDHL